MEWIIGAVSLPRVKERVAGFVSHRHGVTKQYDRGVKYEREYKRKLSVSLTVDARMKHPWKKKRCWSSMYISITSWIEVKVQGDCPPLALTHQAVIARKRPG